MTTVLKLGPADHGRPLTLEEFLAGEYQEGHKYEIIDGKLYVSPAANAPEGFLERWLDVKLLLYVQARPEVINYVHPKARVFVPGRPDLTAPEPDLAAYRGFPLEGDLRELNWEDHSPLLVVEVLSADDPAKDLVRNVELYRQVPSIREYWIVDGRPNPNEPTLIVYRRHGRYFRHQTLPFGTTYTTKLLPGFSLVIDPHR